MHPDRLVAAPNALGQPTQAGSYATGVTYYPNGAIQQFTYGNGIVHTLAQNARGLPDRSRDLNGTTSVHDGYDYDQVGNVLAISDAVSGNRGDRDMAYDDLNRLTSATSPMFGTATYTYDVVDNLRHVTVTGGTQVNNRLTNITSGGATVVGLGYDVQGNLANKSGVTYTFDYGNRLRAGGPETYRYDVQGRRARSSSSAGLVYSLYGQSGQLLFQRDERSGKRRQYVYLGGSLVAESDVPLAGGSATVTYQHTDALGSPVATTNSAKTVLQRSEYEPYGYLLNRPMQDGPGYTGHVTDAATGLVYMQQRYYDPLIGDHFLSVDPVTAYSPGGTFNRYWYASSNPYRFSDPDGRKAGDPYRWASGDFSETETADSKGARQFAKQATQGFADMYDQNDPNWHDFDSISTMCNLSMAHCLEYAQDLNYQEMIPGMVRDATPGPHSLDGSTIVGLPCPWCEKKNPIYNVRYSRGLGVNTTRSGHDFDPGSVISFTFAYRGYAFNYIRGIGTTPNKDADLRVLRVWAPTTQWKVRFILLQMLVDSPGHP